jgi:hypothetical protein
LLERQNDGALHNVMAARAQCEGALARLLRRVDAQSAAEHAGKAGRLYEQLSAQEQEQVRYLVEQLDLQVRQAVESGSESGTQHLIAAANLNKRLQDNWPTSPTEFYEVVCYLTGRSPLLTKLSSSETPE